MKINDILLEGDSLGLTVAKMQQQQIAKDWNKLSTKEKSALLKKERGDAEQRRKEYFDNKSVDEVTDKRPSYVVSTKDKPKKVKPSKDGSSPHPYQGKLVGATEAEQPKDKISARGKLNHSLVAQGHKVEKDRKKSVKRGDVKHKGQIEEGPLAKVAGAAAVLAALGMNMPSGKDTPLGKELASAAQSGDTVAAHYLDNLDSYIDADDQRTLVNLRIAYIDDSPRQDVKAYLAKKAGVNEQGVAEAGPFSYGAKKPRKGSVADLAAKKRKEQEKGKQPIEPRDQKVGTAKVTKTEEQKSMKGKDPCWKGYKMVGTKKKGSKEVPNCVPGKKD